MFAVITLAADAAVAVAAEAGQSSGGLPQLNVNDFAPQLIWLAAMFGLLYIIMSKVALPRVGEVLTERRDRIARDLEAAGKLKADTDKALSDYEQALTEARGKASAMAKDTRDLLSAETEAEKAKIEAQLSAKLQDAETRIADTKAKALLSVNDIAADTASAIVGKLLGQEVSAADVKRVLTAAAGK
jgi:F-type H+-transporting ATPase subunit b